MTLRQSFLPSCSPGYNYSWPCSFCHRQFIWSASSRHAWRLAILAGNFLSRHSRLNGPSGNLWQSSAEAGAPNADTAIIATSIFLVAFTPLVKPQIRTTVHKTNTARAPRTIRPVGFVISSPSARARPAGGWLQGAGKFGSFSLTSTSAIASTDPARCVDESIAPRSRVDLGIFAYVLLITHEYRVPENRAVSEILYSLA